MKLRLVSFATALGALVIAGELPPLARSAQGQEPSTPRPAASSLAPPSSPSKDPDGAGFIRRWLVLEPIRVPPQLHEVAVQTVVKKVHFEDQFTVIPRDAQRLTVDGEPLAWHAVDTLGYNLNLFHFAYALGKPTSNVLFWIVTAVEAQRELSGVRLAIGSNAASVWWLNGEEVIGLYDDRQSVIDDGVSKRVTLKKGRNVIRAAVVNGGGATDFCARFLDEDDKPLKEITVSLSAVRAMRAHEKTRGRGSRAGGGGQPNTAAPSIAGTFKVKGAKTLPE